jgi:hypothetical protein
VRDPLPVHGGEEGVEEEMEVDLLKATFDDLDVRGLALAHEGEESFRIGLDERAV